MGLTTLAIATVAGAAYQGVTQQQAAKKTAGLQKEAQRSAEASAITEREMASQQERRLNKRKPNVAALLSTAQQAATTGPASTMLTGASGATGGATSLGRSSLLGQ